VDLLDQFGDDRETGFFGIRPHGILEQVRLIPEHVALWQLVAIGDVAQLPDQQAFVNGQITLCHG
jgi:hypothetical protein